MFENGIREVQAMLTAVDEKRFVAAQLVEKWELKTKEIKATYFETLARTVLI